jgi:hypothetical protein
VFFLPAILSRNWQLKVLALATAVLLWTVPRFEAQSSRVLEDVPVLVQLTDPDWAVVGDPTPATVSVTLSGSARELIAMGVEAPPVNVPVDQVGSADTTVLLRYAWFRGSSREGVVVEEIRPTAISLSLEPIRRHQLPFSPSIFGELPPGISLAGPPRAEPLFAEVFGPSSRFQGLDSLRLMPIDLALVDGTGSIVSPVDTSGLENLNILPLQAMVTVPTEPTGAREFQGLPLILPSVDRDPQLQARQTSINVVLVGPQSLVGSVEAGDLRVTIPMSRAGLSPGQEERVLLVVEGIPEYVEARATPDWVLLRRPVGQ